MKSIAILKSKEILKEELLEIFFGCYNDISIAVKKPIGEKTIVSVLGCFA